MAWVSALAGGALAPARAVLQWRDVEARAPQRLGAVASGGEERRAAGRDHLQARVKGQGDGEGEGEGRGQGSGSGKCECEREREREGECEGEREREGEAKELGSTCSSVEVHFQDPW
eukprot:scaffold54645_cov46-Phaeocystis_antarctica.AAC.2